MSLIFIDIETLPTNDENIIEQIKKSIEPPGNYSKPETIAKWLDENRDNEADKLIRKTALDGLYGQILSISWAIGDGSVNSVYRSSYADSEMNMLNEFFLSLQDYCIVNKQGVTPITKWIGHYITGFDLRFIWQRCVINNVRPPIKIPYDAKPWDDCVFDTKIAWTGIGKYSGSGSLDTLCSVMLNKKKGEINGANVYDYFLRGEIQNIVDYNKNDVIMCRDLYNRMNFID